MNSPEHCVFCKIALRRMSAIIVYEDDDTLAFMDVHPASDGHTLVISKAHYENLFDIDLAQLAAVMSSAQRVARAIMQALRPDGLRVMQFNGAAAGQSVFHYHVHLRPAYQGQDLRSHGRNLSDQERIMELATRIRAELGE